MDMTVVSFFIIAAFLFVGLKMLPRLIAGVPFVEPKKVFAQMQKDPNAVMIDVRTPEEFTQRHVPDSINVQPHTLADDLEEKKNYIDNKIYVMCLTSQRAAMSAKTLKHLGFTNVSVVDGGLNKWKKQDLPTTP